ncbi:MAG: glycoside hydrolase family 13 protein [Streptococcaceae bacterium]|jgi:glycosidase|nr:glycoside hydrolase family 13 protein [Streptococcaceae bacterium]
MNKAAIFHRPESEDAYLADPETVHIRLQAARDDLTKVVLHYGDPYMVSVQDDEITWEHRTVEMEKVATTELSDFYQIAVHLPHKRMDYLFVLTDNEGEQAILTDRGLMDNAEEYSSGKYAAFRLPFFHEADMYKAPSWVKSTVWYQIFPERFANGDKSNDPDNVKDWDDVKSMRRQDFYGGDLQGIIDHLDHLTELGVNGLYLTPIFKAPSNHKYDTVDYLDIDPHFGDKKTFKQLVEACHKRGIKMMLDGVFNHIGDQSPQWQDVLKNQQQSKYADWFHINSWPATYTETKDFESAPTKSYESFAFTPHMPKLNTANPDVQAFILKVADYWIREFDIDAWRLDVANEVDHQFWKKFRKVCDAAKKDFYIVGEVWHSAQSWLNGDEFTATMNYSYTYAILDYFVKQKNSMKTMVSQLNQQLMLYRDTTNAAMFNILDSHDTERLLFACCGDEALFRQVLAFTYMQPGEPCIYYGDEIGMTGGDDPDCRRPMIWDISEHDSETFWFFHDLVALRKENSELLATGRMNWRVLSEKKGILQLERKLGNQQLFGTFNTGNEVISGDFYNVKLSNLTTFVEETAEIAPRGFVISVG